MTPRLYVLQDDLFFAERVRATARRLGLEPVMLSPAETGDRTWEAGDVVVIQVTLHPDRQLRLIENLCRSAPSLRVVAVTGHLETDLRAQAKALGAMLAAHSSMERVLARACGLRQRDADAPPPPN
ncbi:MAG: hypothetical protein ABI401_05455 [Candidatus Dormibacter sp.]